MTDFIILTKIQCFTEHSLSACCDYSFWSTLCHSLAKDWIHWRIIRHGKYELLLSIVLQGSKQCKCCEVLL